MATENNWMSSNLSGRLSDHSLDFRVDVKPFTYDKVSFDEASNQVCYKLNHLGRKLYIGLSGGIDSEYVFRKFVAQGYVVTPVIVCTSGNKLETPKAIELCKELGVSPVIIEKTETEYLQIIYKYIIKKLNGYGVATPGPIIGGMYAEEHNGIFIKSEHLIDERDDKMYVGANEWDFYNDALINNDNTYYFFLHTPEIVYALVSSMEGESVQKFKTDMYQLPYREKIKFGSYSETFDKVLKVFRSKRIIRPKFNHDFGSKEKFLGDYF